MLSLMELNVSSETKEVDMGCWHGWHGCGPRYAGPYAPSGHECADWYGPAEWEGEFDRPVRRRMRRRRPADMDASEDLQARLDELKVEIERVQAALAGLQDSEEGSPG